MLSTPYQIFRAGHRIMHKFLIVFQLSAAPSTTANGQLSFPQEEQFHPPGELRGNIGRLIELVLPALVVHPSHQYPMSVRIMIPEPIPAGVLRRSGHPPKVELVFVPEVISDQIFPTGDRWEIKGHGAQHIKEIVSVYLAARRFRYSSNRLYTTRAAVSRLSSHSVGTPKSR